MDGDGGLVSEMGPACPSPLVISHQIFHGSRLGPGPGFSLQPPCRFWSPLPALIWAALGTEVKTLGQRWVCLWAEGRSDAGLCFFSKSLGHSRFLGSWSEFSPNTLELVLFSCV